jgi:hypothetical protein
MKAKALLEVVAVFSLTLFLMALIGLSPVGEWERQVLHHFYFEYTVMIAFPLLILLLTRRSLAAYGLSSSDMRYHMNIALTCFVPVALSFIPAAFVDHKTRNGALIMAVVQIALLFALGWLLRRKPTRNESGMLLGAFSLVALSNFAQMPALTNAAAIAVSAFIFYIFFLGLGEELLFRGYIQSRLNAVWGRPHQFFGVRWGWGAVIMSLLFGLMHVINIGSLITGNWQLEPWWGFWTFFGGLVFAFVREKTGSIAASTILHGLPQALYSAF